MPAEPDRNAIYEALNSDAFTLEDLEDLSFNLQVDWDALKGETKGAKARALVIYIQARSRLPELAQVIDRERPGVLRRPVETADTGIPNQIPAPPLDFVGREQELEILLRAVEQGGTVISGVHGLGGIGKTALACKLVQLLGDRYPDGHIMLDLRGPEGDPSVPPEQILAHILQSYDREARLPDELRALQSLYRSMLTGKRVLILLDNARDAEQIAPLLPPPPGSLALVTSRVQFTFPGLRDIKLEELPEADALRLLLEIEPRIEGEAKELAKVCGYLPLALRVVASLLHKRANLTPQDLLRRMQDDRRRLELSGVDASLGLSDAMLPVRLQEKWHKLGVFAGDFGLEATAWVWGMVTEKTREEEKQRAGEDAQDILGELGEYSLVDFVEGRYRLHDLARIYAMGKMEDAEQYAARLAHARYYISLLWRCHALYLQGKEHVGEGLALFDHDRREISAAQIWIAAADENERERLELSNQYPNAGRYPILLRLHPRERIRWLEAGLRAARLLNNRKWEGFHLGNLGLAYAALGDTRRAISYYENRLVIAREIGDQQGESRVLGNLGFAYYFLGEAQRAIDYYKQDLDISRALGDRRGEGSTLGNLGLAYAALGDARRAIEYYEQQLVIARETGDRLNEGNALGTLGDAYADLGDARRAIEFNEQQLAIAREIGDRSGEGSALSSLGNVYYDLGDSRRAIEYYEQHLTIAREIGDRRSEAIVRWDMGSIFEQQGDLARAIEAMQARVDYEREIGHADAEKHSAQVEEIRKRAEGKDITSTNSNSPSR